jgi:hypothetical protein
MPISNQEIAKHDPDNYRLRIECRVYRIAFIDRNAAKDADNGDQDDIIAIQTG